MAKIDIRAHDCWCVFSGEKYLTGNRYLVQKPDINLVKEYEDIIAALDVPSSCLMVGEAKDVLPTRTNWIRCDPCPFMIYNLEKQDNPLVRDSRVYVATNQDFERVADAMADAFGRSEEMRLGSFAQAARSIDGYPDMKLYLVDNDEGQVASLVFAVTVENSSVLLAMGTREGSRRKGFGRAILTNALLDAQQEGLKQSILFASDLGKLLYSSLGFEVIEDWNRFKTV